MSLHLEASPNSKVRRPTSRGFPGVLRGSRFLERSSPFVRSEFSGASLFVPSVAIQKHFQLSFLAAHGGAEEKKGNSQFPPEA